MTCSISAVLSRIFFSRAGMGCDRRRNSAMTDFKGGHFERDVILRGVQRYVAYR